MPLINYGRLIHFQKKMYKYLGISFIPYNGPVLKMGDRYFGI